MSWGQPHQPRRMQEPLTEEEIGARLATRPDLLERFKAGDNAAFIDLLELATGCPIDRSKVTIRRVPARE